MIEGAVDRSLLDSLAQQMRGESSEELGARIRDGIPATLPRDEGGYETRLPTTRQFLEAWVASHELERRARGLAGEPPPAPIYEIIAIDPSDPSIVAPGIDYHYEPPSEVEVAPEKPWWWDAAERHVLSEETEVAAVELPADITLEELEAKILRGMPRREGDHWRIPDSQELAEAHAALAALVLRARETE